MLLLKVYNESWEKKVTGKSQHEFTNCLTNLMPCVIKCLDLCMQGQQLDFSKAFDTVSHNILISKVRYIVWASQQLDR